MASRILTCVSCTLYVCILSILTVIGLTAIVIALIGVGLYIPTLINYNSYISNSCFIISHTYGTCQQQNSVTCFSDMWSVRYSISNRTSQHYLFATITLTFSKSTDALTKLKTYVDNNTYPCYYSSKDTTTVKWDSPTSPRPYLIMIIVGFSLSGIYFIVLAFIGIYRCQRA
jgi:hypothetical protein